MKMKLDKNMANEVQDIIEAVIEIDKAMSSIGVHVSDTWMVLDGMKNDSPVEIDGLTGDARNVDKLIGIETDKLTIGLSISTGPICLNGKYVQPPESFELEKAKILEHYMLIELELLKKHLNFLNIRFADNGIIDDGCDGWEHWMGFIIEENPNYTSKQSIIKDILNEEDGIIEFGYIYNNPNEMASRPVGDWRYMIEFFSAELICPDDDFEKYRGNFDKYDLNGTYIRECMDIINDVEMRVKELKEKYDKYDIEITIGDFNIGCQYGMAVYVWVPEK